MVRRRSRSGVGTERSEEGSGARSGADLEWSGTRVERNESGVGLRVEQSCVHETPLRVREETGALRRPAELRPRDSTSSA